jgi:conjugative relaxase-like TrwC/TraI family protein
MVSIGKLSVGQARYYLDQAGGPVTATGALTSGVDDYYLGGPEAAGRWLGRGAGALGLNGRVGDDALHAVLAGSRPATREVLRTRGSVAGFDVGDVAVPEQSWYPIGTRRFETPPTR